MKNRLLSPSYFNFLLVLAIGLHFVLPIKRMMSSLQVGFILITLGIILNMWSGGTLRRNNTTIDFNGTPYRLVTDGPFRFSRNPIYLSGVILSLGVAIILGSLIIFIFAIVMFVIMDRFYIPIEENNLANEFGRSYHEYKQRVRRWI